MSTATASKQECIDNCQECQTIVSDMLTATCLAEGGDHVEQNHVKLMLDCIAACNACVGFMSRNSDYHAHYCKACAEICKACADSCEQVGGMDKCVECCRKCEESCIAMAA
ncbi:MAG: four-helix bundle copper-binding protein [Rhodopirellula sp. JB044]|uniref:four-helix bundle copper-binding protein n=1 Tax=Rhodopirellula sp. JB044 TaxID=3342844 RepID=UPI00370CCDA8